LRTKALALYLRKANFPEIEIRLMTESLDGKSPFRDPQNRIGDLEIDQVTHTLNILPQQARTLFEGLAEKLGLLQLAWR
jgi:hypothetical protein